MFSSRKLHRQAMKAGKKPGAIQTQSRTRAIRRTKSAQVHCIGAHIVMCPSSITKHEAKKPIASMKVARC